MSEQSIEETRRSLYECKAKGWIDLVGVDESGDEIWSLTHEGKRHVEEMLPTPAIESEKESKE